jgi:pyruvate-ferredoxin/flavodoxin oxidoreductase
VVQAVFYGLGADGTVGANKNSVKIIAEDAGLFAQGYFVYDSHKSGAQTISHLRFGPRPIQAPYLIQQASFVGIHQFQFITRQDVLRLAAPGATVLLNTQYGPDEVWDHLPRAMQLRIIEQGLRLYVIDASRVAQEVGLRGRTNTVLQTCFFAISGVLPRDQAIDHIKRAIKKTYGGKGAAIVEANYRAVDGTLAQLFEAAVPDAVTSRWERPPVVPVHAPAFVRDVTAAMLEGRGDEIPVSHMPVDGTWPSGTSVWEKRNIADEVPVWQQDTCIQCGQCSFVCPHGVIQAKYFDGARLDGAPAGFRSAPINVRGFPDVRFALDFAVEDCTGCGLCVEACPVVPAKALVMQDKIPLVEPSHADNTFFAALPVNDRARVDFANVRGVQFLEPLFSFSGACAGCGETPYLKLLSQLFGDRAQIANATGCSSIYGGNLPVTPWSTNREGRGPAWSNSLFEDNAEFGLGFRLAADKHLDMAQRLAREMAPALGADLVEAVLTAPQVQ